MLGFLPYHDQHLYGSPGGSTSPALALSNLSPQSHAPTHLLHQGPLAFISTPAIDTNDDIIGFNPVASGQGEVLDEFGNPMLALNTLPC